MNYPLIFIFITLSLDLLGFGLLLPVIPFLVGQYSKDALTIGLLAVSFSAAQFIASPVLGTLSDRYGRRPILLISLLGTSLGYFIFGFANALWLLFAARLLDGFSSGNISTSEAYIADISSPQDRVKNFGLIGAAFGLAFIFGPALGGLLGQISLQAPAFAAGILSLATTIFGFFALPESLPPQKREQRPIRLKELNPIAQVGHVLQRPILRELMLANSANIFVFSVVQTNFALFTFVRFGLGTGANGAIFSYIGVLAVLTQVLIVRRLVKHFRDKHLAIVSFGMMAVGSILISFVPTVWMLYLGITFMSVGNGLATPTLMGLISKQVAIEEQGNILGTSQAIASLTQVVAPIWAGAVFDYIGISSPYWTGAIWLVIAVWLVAKCQIKLDD